MKQADFNRFDFDSMADIAKNAPDEFERMRRAAIEELIASAPLERQKRLRSLQWRIDQERRNRSPLSACIRISKMMWDQLLSPDGLLGAQARLLVTRGVAEIQNAKVIPFPERGLR